MIDNLIKTFMEFQNCNFLKKLKITKPVGQKFVQQQFKKKKRDIQNLCLFEAIVIACEFVSGDFVQG